MRARNIPKGAGATISRRGRRITGRRILPPAEVERRAQRQGFSSKPSSARPRRLRFTWPAPIVLSDELTATAEICETCPHCTPAPCSSRPGCRLLNPSPAQVNPQRLYATVQARACPEGRHEPGDPSP